MKKNLPFRKIVFAVILIFAAKGYSQLNVKTFTYTGTIESYTVPQSCDGSFTIEAVGAGGGSVNVSCTANGGLGASMKGVFTFTPGTVLRILAGGVGQTSGSDGGGGGGSFVVELQGTTPLVVAGGGGGASNNLTNCGANIDGDDASITTTATAAKTGGAMGGVNGNGGAIGGNTLTSGGAGGGFYTDGAVGAANSNVNAGGKAFVNGGAGGTPNTVSTAGGFGGGGCSWSTGGGGGGGGGYSGGGSDQQSGNYGGGGGGGSFNAGNNQVNTAGANAGNGYVTITYKTGAAITLSPSAPVICSGDNVIITASGNGISSYTWSTGSNNMNITVTPSVSTVYSVQATDLSNCVSSNSIAITVNPLPNVTAAVSPTLLCVGKTATVTASGANTFTWDSGPTTNSYMVSPQVTTIYSVTGTSNLGCVKGQTIAVPVNSNTLTLTPDTAVCAGSSATLIASGAQTYTWGAGQVFNQIIETPSVTTMYMASGTDINGCVLSNSVTITVNAVPVVGLNANKSKVCRNELVTLTATGADSYTFSPNTNGSGATATTIPTVDVPHHYSVTGMNASGCTHTAIVTIQVERCTGVGEEAVALAKLFPNPAFESLTVELDRVPENALIMLYDASGKIVISIPARAKNYLDLRQQAIGVYFIRLKSSEAETQIGRILKQ